MEEATSVNIWWKQPNAKALKWDTLSSFKERQASKGARIVGERETEGRGRIGRDGQRGEARHRGEEADRQGDKDDNVLKKDNRGPIPEGCRPLLKTSAFTLSEMENHCKAFSTW